MLPGMANHWGLVFFILTTCLIYHLIGQVLCYFYLIKYVCERYKRFNHSEEGNAGTQAKTLTEEPWFCH